MEFQIHRSLISALHSTQVVDWEQVQIATTSDENMFLLFSIIEDGFPESKCQLPSPIREYHQFRKHLYSSNGAAIYKDRIVIPPPLRPICLSALHAAHQQKQKHQSFGLALRRTSGPLGLIACIATGWPHHKRHCHHPFHPTSIPIPVHICILLPIPTSPSLIAIPIGQ